MSWLGLANGLWGTSTQGANTAPANASVWGWLAFANSASATGDLLADIDPAVSTWNAWDPSSKYGTVYAKMSIVPADYARGGIVPGFAGGGGPGLGTVPHAAAGMFHGSGTGTSDSNLVAISNGEFIEPAAVTARNLGLLEYIRTGGEVAWTPAASTSTAAPASTSAAAPASGTHAGAPAITINGYMASPGELVEKMNRELAWALRV
jgi:hypothetical protein